MNERREHWNPNESDSEETVAEKQPRDVAETLGSSTGEAENAIEAGGWTGTDDATSTAPSDLIGLPKEEEDEPLHVINKDFDEAADDDEASQSAEFGTTAELN